MRRQGVCVVRGDDVALRALSGKGEAAARTNESVELVPLVANSTHSTHTLPSV